MARYIVMRHHFGITIRNPFNKSGSGFVKNLMNPHWLVAPHKVLELQIYGEPKFFTLLTLVFEIIEKDHAGWSFEMGLLGGMFALSYYDTRHWDHENNCWEKYDKEENSL
jgi:hypothetical protein